MTIVILTHCFTAAGQDCDGSLLVQMDGSNSNDTMMVDLDTRGITCQAELNGYINLIISGGNGGYQFQWADDVNAQHYRDSLAHGIYDVTITDSKGCQEIVSANIELQTPENTALAMETGCGTCLMTNGALDYFFNQNDNYIAAIIDDDTDNEQLGDTEVCLERTTEPVICATEAYLQRVWSITPSENNPACLKLFFTEKELEELINIHYDSNFPNAIDLINNKSICVTGFSGGDENCSDFISAKIYSQTDADPLEITLEDTQLGIWSASICTNEYASFYLQICDQQLPTKLLSFYGRIISTDNYIYWITENERRLSHYQLEYSRDLNNWEILTTVLAKNQLYNEYQYIHKDPGPGIAYYRLNIIEQNNQASLSNIISLFRGEAGEENFSPNLFTEETYFEAYPSVAGIYEFVFYNEVGLVAYHEKVFFQKGYSRYRFDLGHIPAAAYFCQVTTTATDNKPVTYKLIKVTR